VSSHKVDRLRKRQLPKELLTDVGNQSESSRDKCKIKYAYAVFN